MKLFFASLVLMILLVACNGNSVEKNSVNNNTEVKTTTNLTQVMWMDTLKNVGQVKFGETVQIDFEFKNTGNSPLLIVSVEPGCGCTVADYPKQAIAAGETGKITAAFDSNKGNEGDFKKNIMVRTNTDEANRFLYFTGIIVK